MVLPPHAAVLAAFDKRQTTYLAKSLGIAVPQTVLIDNDAQARRLAQAVRYPAVLKPCASEEITSTGQVRATGRPSYVRTPHEFLAA